MLYTNDQCFQSSASLLKHACVVCVSNSDKSNEVSYSVRFAVKENCSSCIHSS